MIDINTVNKVYFVGIGGVGMSATAGLAKDFGMETLGSDSHTLYAPAKDILEENNIPYFPEYNEKQVKDSGADLFILSSGADLNNPEVKYIVEHNLPRASFPELLYELAKDELRVVVAGTHGKSTTTGLLGHLLKNIDDSSFMAGAVLQNYNSNFYRGHGHYFVFEGDEYKSQFDDPTPKFHYYKPDILVLTNLEFDHPDLFENFEAMTAEFEQLIQSVPEDGLIVYNADDAALSKLVHQTNVTSVSFGINNEADYQVLDITNQDGYTVFNVKNKFSKDIKDHILGKTEEYKTQLPGKINVYNALASVATLRALGFAYDLLALDLLTYTGVKRRFENVGTKNGVTIIDDYAHHPTAVRETLEAARLRYEGAKIWAVFEPHTFSRTKATLPDLASSFDSANEALISEIYAAREQAKNSDITANNVVKEVNGRKGNKNLNVRPVAGKQEALDILKTELKPGDVVVVMAVGNFNRLAYDLLEEL